MSTFQKDLFRDRLRALRKQRKLTQADAAEQLEARVHPDRAGRRPRDRHRHGR